MSVRETYYRMFKLHMSRKFRRMRYELDLPRDRMAEMFMMDARSYWDLEMARSGPSGITLALYLMIADEKDIMTFITEIRELLAKAVEVDEAS